jgi:hypothetical protein
MERPLRGVQIERNLVEETKKGGKRGVEESYRRKREICEN